MTEDYDWTTPAGMQRFIVEMAEQQERLDEREHRLDLLEARLLGVQESITAVLYAFNSNRPATSMN